MLSLNKEPFIGKYDGISPPTLLSPGSIVDGQNMRRIGDAGGWKTREGATLHNTTTISAHSITSLVHYTHPRNDDAHFFAQLNSKIYEMTNLPPTAGAQTGTDIGVVTGTSPLFWDVVDEALYIGDGVGVPITYGGNNPFCKGFLGYFDLAGFTYVDYTRWTTDNRADTWATLNNGSTDKIYILSSEKASAIKLTMGSTVNSQAVLANVKAWRSGTWTLVDNLVDGTVTAGATLTKSGTITWTANSLDTMKVIEGRMGYWYEITFTGALTNLVTILGCQVVFAMQRMTNKWNGIYEWIGACRLFDGTNYKDETGNVTNESTSIYMSLSVATSSYYMYLKTPEPVTAFGIGIVGSYQNSTASTIDQVEVWTGTVWTSISTLSDGTYDGSDSSFAQSGTLLWNAAGVANAVRRSFSWDSIPGYWYRISWTATLGNDVRVWGITYIPYPEALAPTDGCIEFKGRLFTWGDPEYPNRLRYSAKDSPDCFCGSDSGYTEAFGDKDEILLVRRFYNELLIWKKGEIYLLEGYSPATFGSLRVSATVGIASPASGHVVESGVPIMKADEVLTVAIWQEVDGVYMLDGRKPKKISGSVEQHFNSSYSTAIPAGQLRNRQAFLDRLNNEYHFLLGSGELVYNYVRDEWYPKWERYVDLTCGLNFKAVDNKFYTYGGSATGFIFRMENGTVDIDTTNVSRNVIPKLKTRAISATQKNATTMRLTFRKLWLEAKQVTGGSVSSTLYPDLAVSGITLDAPSPLNLERTGYNLAIPALFTRQEGMDCFQIELVGSGVFEVYSMLYEVDVLGEMFNVV